MIKRLTEEKNIAAMIFLFAAYLSYGHTLEMFARSGYQGLSSHIGTLAVEALFWMGLVSLNRARKAGLTTSKPARTAFIVGGVIVLYSNITANIANGHPIIYVRFSELWRIGEPEIIGVIIFAVVFISESVVAFSSKNTNQHPELEPAATQVEDSRPTNIEPETPAAITPPATVDEPATTEEYNQPPTVNQQDKMPITTATTADERKTTTKSVSSATEEETKRVLEIAKQFLEATGKRPGRDVLVDLAKCSSNRAREVLVILKQQQQQQQKEKPQQQPKLELVK